MKYLIYFIAIILLIGINVGGFSHLKIAGTSPNLLLILVVIFSLEKDDGDYFFIALMSGLFLDFYTGAFLGSYALAFLFLGLILKAFLWRILVLEAGWKSLFVALAVSVIFVALFVQIYSSIVFKFHWSPQYLSFQGFWKKNLVELVYDLLLFYPMLNLARLLRYINENLLAKNRRVN